MSQSNERELQLLRKHFLSLVSEESPIISRPLTDLFLLADCATGTLHLYDDEDKEISHVSVFAWAETGTESEPSEVAIETLRELVTRLEQKGFWDRPCFARPFSIELIRPDFSVIEDLLFLDEDLIKIEPPAGWCGRRAGSFLGRTFGRSKIIPYLCNAFEGRPSG